MDTGRPPHFLSAWLASSPKIGDFSEGRDNNFNLIRAVAAVAVILSHSFAFTSGKLEFWGVTPGNLAVRAFFVISGFLITRSWLRSKNWRAFALARTARIYPALWLVVALCVFIVGWQFTNLDTASYFKKGQTWEYFFANCTLAVNRMTLPGVFLNMPFPEKVNGSLWTLRYEVFLYLVTGLLGLVGILRNRDRFGVLMVCGFLFLYFVERLGEKGFGKLVGPLGFSSDNVQYLALLYLCGTSLYIFRTAIPLNWAMTGVVAALATVALACGQVDTFFSMGFAYVVLALAFLPGGWIRNYNRLGDYSYGIYIYGAPIQGMLVTLSLATTPLSLFGWTMLAVLIPAIFSWHCVERPALNWAARRIKSMK